MIVAVVLTHNRCRDLERCLPLLAAQTQRPDETFVVDGASTDGTRELLATRREVTPVLLDHNPGSAGGFAAGVRHALAAGADWIWLLDDDCFAHPDALRQLLAAASGSDEPESLGALAPAVCAVGEVAGFMNDGRARTPTSPGWPDPDGVDWASFAGLLLSAQACHDVGPIREDFFIWNDDCEYTGRLSRRGWRILSVPRARIVHPPWVVHHYRLGPRRGSIAAVPPWKDYYSVRNGLVLQREQRRDPGLKSPPLSRRVLAELKLCVLVLVLEEGGHRRLWMRARGYADAIRGRMGRRVEPGYRSPASGGGLSWLGRRLARSSPEPPRLSPPG